MLVLTHVPSQSVAPPVHSQAPSVQRPKGPQLVPQAPQLRGSVSVSTQSAPHIVRPPGQDAWQVPPAQSSPLAHAVPQAPQFIASVLVSTQLAPHSS